MRRAQMRILRAALDMTDTAASADFAAFPKFLANQAVTTASALWNKLPRVRLEW